MEPTTLYDEYVRLPETAEEEIVSAMHEYKQAGLDGCIGSIDATHVYVTKAESSLKNLNTGKEQYQSRTFNVAVNHRRKIIHSTHGAAGSFNDKTLIRGDKFAQDLRYKRILQDVEYSLYKADGTKETRKGPWLMVDNGYHMWTCTVSPFKFSTDEHETRWSRWLESMRKDVECTFGILKGRFRILKVGIRLHGVQVVDDIWFTCCALHNMLLEVDGRSAEWRNGVRGFYEDSAQDEAVEDQIDDKDSGDAIPLIFRRLGVSRHNTNSVGLAALEHDVQVDSSYLRFRSDLVANFAYRFQHRRDVPEECIRWPLRNGVIET